MTEKRCWDCAWYNGEGCMEAKHKDENIEGKDRICDDFEEADHDDR